MTKTKIYPLPLGAKLGRSVKRAAKLTGLSNAELMRQALGFGLPEVLAALAKKSGRITNVEPWTAAQARAIYSRPDDDREQIDAMIAAQVFPGVGA